MTASAEYQTKRLRDAADRIAHTGATVGDAEITQPVCMVLLAAAERIERAGSSLGLPVSHALSIAEAVLNQDLGSNKDYPKDSES